METDYAWAAGIFDGDGHLGIHHMRLHRNEKRYYRATLLVGNTNKDMIDRLQELFGGHVSEALDKGRGCKVFYVWRANVKGVTDILLKVLPYLVTKKKQAELLLALRQNIERNVSGSRYGLLPEIIEYRASLHEKVKELNSGG